MARDSEAESSMMQTDKLCVSRSSLLAADVTTARGQVLDDGQAAEKDFRSALEIARQQHDSFREASALLNLSNEALIQEHYDRSVEWSQASFQICNRYGYGLIEEKCEGNLGWSYFRLGNYDEAISLLRQSERSANALKAESDEVAWLNDLGLVEERIGQLAAARRDYEAALSNAQQQHDKDQTTIALDELAFLSIRISDWNNAQKFSELALKSARDDQDHPLELQALLAQGLIASHRGNLKAAETLLAQVANDPKHDRQSLRWEAQASLADLYAKERDLPAAATQYRVSLSTAAQARCSIRAQELRLPFSVNTSSVYDRYIDFLVQQGKTAEALTVADESRALTLAEGMGVDGKKCLAAEDSFNPQQLARRTKSTILVYWLGAEHSYLWAIDGSRMKLYPLPPAAEIESAVAAYGQSLVGPWDVLQTQDKHGEYLYQTLAAPAAEFFHQDGRVVVVADGALSGLGFDSLIVSGDGPQAHPHYWIDDVTVENASSMRLLAKAPAHRMPTGGKLLLLGDPLPVSEFPTLPHAADEVATVKASFSAANEQVYEQAAATSSSYLASHPEQFAYIDFVAHGSASLTDPLDSAVVLSPPLTSATASGSGADTAYKLYARDIVTHPVKAELVTISACSSAGKRIYKGEGLVGLSWAFLGAGAHNVIGTLWDISDDASPQLMSVLYSELGKGSAPDAALRAAKLSLLHSNGVLHKPIYWAAFQLYTRS